MSNRSQFITPNQKQALVYTDITENLEVSPMTNQLALVTNETDVLNSLRRIVLMGQYDREYDDLGGNVRKMLMEPIDKVTATILTNLVEEACRREVRANILSVNVNEYADQDMYVVTIQFSTRNNTLPISFDVILKRIR